jgi:DNA-binding MarR family transcriptional regulator
MSSKGKKNKTPITQAHYETLAEFRYALRKFLHFSEAAAQAVGVTPQQHQAMLAIKGFPGRDHVTIGELAERLQIKHHSAVGLADRLVAESYVARAADPGDRRQVYLTLTPRGEAVLEKLSATHREQLHRIGPQINRLLASLQGASDAPASRSDD